MFFSLCWSCKDKCCSLEDLYNACKYSEIFINYTMQINFSKTPALHLSCLGLCTHTQMLYKIRLQPIS